MVKHAPWGSAAAERLAHEARVLQRARHPSLVRLEAVLEDDAGRELVLANCPGGSLADEVAAGRSWSGHTVADAGARIAAALAVLHANGVVHGDVHPGNVVLDAELQPVLIDLEHALPTGTIPTEVVGHEDHLDHRLLTGRPVSFATDLHALATTLWTLGTGTPPDRSGPDAPVELVSHPAIPAALHSALDRCIRHEVDSAAALSAELAGIARELAAGRAPASEPSRPAARPAVEAPTTRHWGPPAPGPGAITTLARPRPPAIMTAALVVLALALGLGALSRWAAGATVDTSGATATTETRTTASTPGHAAAVGPPDACVATPGAGGRLRVDVDGDGCAEPVSLADGVLHTPTAAYAFGEPGDVLLVGDWDGDGRVGLGLYRPATGAVLLVDEPGPGARSRPAHYLDADALPRVITDASGTRVDVGALPPG